MEDKIVILSVIMMSLVMLQIQVEAKSCCPSQQARNDFNNCEYSLPTPQICALLTGCKLIPDGTTCPSGYIYDIFENSGDGVNKYCKLGCVSSVCSSLKTLKNSDASEIVNGAVDHCVKACWSLCNKG